MPGILISNGIISGYDALTAASANAPTLSWAHIVALNGEQIDQQTEIGQRVINNENISWRLGDGISLSHGDVRVLVRLRFGVSQIENPRTTFGVAWLR